MTGDGWDAAAYARSFARLCAGAVEPLLDALGPAASGRLLDPGTGTGQVAAAARGRGWAVGALDADLAMVAHARLRLPDAEVVRGDALALPWPDAAFDAVAAGFVVNHVADPRAALGEARRVLRPDGRLALTIWPSGTSALNALWIEVAAAGPAGPARRLPAETDFERSPAGVDRLLEGAGFRDVTTREIRWTFAIEPDAPWTAVEGGLATIGAAYRAQDAAGRARMRDVYERYAGEHGADGLLRFAVAAVVGAGVR